MTCPECSYDHAPSLPCITRRHFLVGLAAGLGLAAVGAPVAEKTYPVFDHEKINEILRTGFSKSLTYDGGLWIESVGAGKDGFWLKMIEESLASHDDSQWAVWNPES